MKIVPFPSLHRLALADHIKSLCECHLCQIRKLAILSLATCLCFSLRLSLLAGVMTRMGDHTISCIIEFPSYCQLHSRTLKSQHQINYFPCKNQTDCRKQPLHPMKTSPGAWFNFNFIFPAH